MTNGVKNHLSYGDQVALLASRGMDVGDPAAASQTLQRISYYRLSGYWYPFRELTARTRSDDFYPGTRLDDVVSLYDFDSRLRAGTFSVLTPIELALRAILGHELGEVDPCAHLDPNKLGPTARRGNAYARWHASYALKLERSREDFVAHHRARYGGRLPIWAAVEILDWGSLTYLFGFAPHHVQTRVADACGLSSPQLASWLKSLNLIRNTCAHHGRLFNRVHAIRPKLPRPGIHPDLDQVAADWTRTFGQLTLIQFLLDRLNLGQSGLLPAVLGSFPVVKSVPLTHLGASTTWQTSSRLWS